MLSACLCFLVVASGLDTDVFPALLRNNTLLFLEQCTNMLCRSLLSFYWTSIPQCWPFHSQQRTFKNLNILHYVYWNDYGFCCPSLIPEVAKFLPRFMSTVWRTSLSSSGRAGTREKSLSSLCLRILILSSFLKVLFMTLRVMSCPFCPFST